MLLALHYLQSMSPPIVPNHQQLAEVYVLVATGLLALPAPGGSVATETCCFIVLRITSIVYVASCCAQPLYIDTRMMMKHSAHMPKGTEAD